MYPFYFLLFFSLAAFSSEYKFSFEKVQGIPSDIQIWTQKNYPDWPVVKALNRQNQGFDKSDYTFDEKNLTAACLEKRGLSNEYQIFFCHNDVVGIPHGVHCPEKPLCIGVSNNILLTLSKEWIFSFIKVPFDRDNKYYYTRFTEKEMSITFTDTQKMIQEQLALAWCEDSRLYCFPGDYGRFYLTYDSNGKKDLYLLTIEEKKTEEKNLLSSGDLSDPKTESKSGGDRKFFTIPRLLIMSGLIIGVLLFVFKNQVSKLAPFLRNCKSI